MKIYLDVSCLCRPFDDQSQARIRLEAEAVAMIFEGCEQGRWQQVSSDMANIEIAATTNADRRTRVQLLLPDSKSVIKLTEAIYERAGEVGKMGFKPADATHIAAAEALEADVFLSCDERRCGLAKRRQTRLTVQIANPMDWLREIGHDTDT
jgi:hypothetical protein